MKSSKLGAALALSALLSACGGGGGSSGATATGGTGTVAPTPTPTSASNGCSLRERQDWAAAQMREWYLFPELLPANLDPAPYSSVEDYVDALTATARAQNKDRYFTYLTSISGEDAYYDSGSSAGFGVRLSYDITANRVFVAEAFEGTTALAAGIDRGAEIVAIGTSKSNLRDVSALMAAGGPQAVSDALGPTTAGTSRVLKINDADGTRNVTVAKSDYDLTPVSSRYGAKVIADGGEKVGYVNLRTFINPADLALRSAFAKFRTAGVTRVVVDLRYNGGGLVSIAELLSNLLGANRSASDVLDYTVFRPSKSSENVTTRFTAQPQSVAAMKIAFIGAGGTASASEFVINAFIPYLHANAGLIGTNTYGKPVGQLPFDKPECDDRLRVVSFATQNADHKGGYYDGLAGTVEASCRADDDLSHPLGSPEEASTRQALDFLEGKACTPIAGASGAAAARSLRAVAAPRALLTPDRPNTVQREVPGSF